MGGVRFSVLFAVSLASGISLSGCNTVSDVKPASSVSACKVYPNVTDRQLPSTNEYIRTTSLSDIYNMAIEKNTLDPGKVLVVFDIDDTLLKNTHATEVASSAWVNWQETLTFEDKQDPCRIAKTGDDLYNFVGLFYSAMDLQETEQSANEILAMLGAQNIFTHALTSRSPSNTGATLRELDDNELYFNPPTCKSGICKVNGVLPHLMVEAMAYDTFGCQALLGPAKLSSFSGKNSKCVGYAKPTAPFSDGAIFTMGREVSVTNGIMLSEGQNKGVMLELLLQSFSSNRYETQKFKHVIFVDDSEKNIRKIAAVKKLNTTGSRLSQVSLSLYHYDRNEERDKLLNDGKALMKSKQQFDELFCAATLYGEHKNVINLNCKP